MTSFEQCYASFCYYRNLGQTLVKISLTRMKEAFATNLIKNSLLSAFMPIEQISLIDVHYYRASICKLLFSISSESLKK